MSMKRTCAISSAISFLTSAAICSHEQCAGSALTSSKGAESGGQRSAIGGIFKQTPNLPTPKLRTPISELPSSNFDLSGLASLRETSVIQRREQIFTRRRKGAKRSEVRRQRTKDRSQTFATANPSAGGSEGRGRKISKTSSAKL